MILLGGHRGMGCTDHARFAWRGRDVPAENTLESVAAAFAAGADFVEIDVVPTADGQVAVIHNVTPRDHFFGPDVPGPPLNMLRWRDFKDIPVGRNGNGRVCLLAEMLALVASKAPAGRPFAVNIELKGVRKSGQPWEGEGFVEAVAKVVRGGPLEVGRVLFSSFALRHVVLMAERLPQARYGMLFGEAQTPETMYGMDGDVFDLQNLPFEIAYVEQCAHEFARLVTNGAKLGSLHPEVGTLSDKMFVELGRKGWSFNTWGLFERVDGARRERYARLAEISRAEGIGLGFITDDLAAMAPLRG